MLPRDNLILEFWDRKKELGIKNKEYAKFANDLIGILLKHDINKGDTTSNSLIKNKEITAVIIAKEKGIVAGLEEFSLINKDLKLKFLKKDGDKIKYGDVLIEISGNANKILERERVSLNLLQRMSGIATNVNKLNKKLNNKIKLAATRKTLWELLDKKAVSIGGGLTHRLNLNDGVIIKDNHLKILNDNFESIINSVKFKSKYIEIEIEDKNQSFDAARIITEIKKDKKLKNILFAIMFDKIPPNEIKEIINDLKDKKLYDDILFEASGNINEINLTDYADCGVDVVSIGSITNSAKILDMSLEIK
ncbi:MAG TPA: carboxylating nicotinate-nucleotide diphosphorylase [Candidatus Nanoarchaeia archaeon]|nr:carboxylating nicotinate-nucleotide diphosphorylase [Candidatus Nanoarchaeia archaeon]